jgi:hypothetical protein
MSPSAEVPDAVELCVRDRDHFPCLGVIHRLEPDGRIYCTRCGGTQPGVNLSNVDVGGTNIINTTGGSLSVHGGSISDTRLLIDGVTIANTEGTGWSANMLPNMGSTQEVAVDYSAATAESISGGLQINMIPKTGSNRYTGTLFATGATSSMQSSNTDAALVARGLATPNSVKAQADINPGLGGPLKQDVLWFYTSGRFTNQENYVGGLFQNKNAGDITKWTYVADTANQAVNAANEKSVNLRLTWQANLKNKFNFIVDIPDLGCSCRLLETTTDPALVDAASIEVNRRFASQRPQTTTIAAPIAPATRSSFNSRQVGLPSLNWIPMPIIQSASAGSVTLRAVAHYTTGEADGEQQAVVPRVTSIQLALTGAGNATWPLAADWQATEGASTAWLTLPEVPDGDYQLHASYETRLGKGEVTLPLGLYTPSRIHVITDRPLYEPGNTVRFRAVVLRARDLAPLDHRPGVWIVRDPAGEVLLEEAAPAGEWGVVAGSFPLDKAARTGAWKTFPEMPSPRHGAGTAVLGARILVIGGAFKTGYGPTPAIDVLVTAEPGQPACQGDCNGNGEVSTDEIAQGTHLIFDPSATASCPRSA